MDRAYRRGKNNNVQLYDKKKGWTSWMKQTNMFKNTAYQSRWKMEQKIKLPLLFFFLIKLEFLKNLPTSETTGTYDVQVWDL